MKRSRKVVVEITHGDSSRAHAARALLILLRLGLKDRTDDFELTDDLKGQRDTRRPRPQWSTRRLQHARRPAL